MDRKKIINIYILIITIISALAIIIGICGGIGIGSPVLSFGKAAGVSESSELDAFENIKLDMSVCEINLIAGDGYELKYNPVGVAAKQHIPQAEVSNGTLRITQKKSKNVSIFKSFEACDITITVPRDANLECIEIKTEVGDINIDDILCEDITINSNVGDIDLKNAEGNSMELTADVGDVDITKCKYDTVSVESNVGDVNISNTICNDVSVKSDIGDVTLGDVKDSSGNEPQMDINLDIGEKKIL